jgi:carbamoyl-phosphate synthase large subunit
LNVLITSASRKVALVRSFQDAVAKEGGGCVIAVDASPNAAALYIADEHYLVPRSDDESFIPTLATLCRERNSRLVIPTRDEELPLFAKHRETFDRMGVRVMVPSLSTVEICQDKLRFAKFCAEKSLGTPRTYEDLEEAVFPLFVKPRRGKGSRGTFLVHTRRELEGALAYLGAGALAQEYIDAPEYTIDLFADFSGNVLSVVPRQRILVVGGESFVSKTVRNPLLSDEAIRLAHELGLVGHSTIQGFLIDGAVKFIEVNPRYGGGAALSFAAGAPTPLYLVKLLKGERLRPMIGSFKENYVMLRYTNDLFLEEESLAQRRFE